ncbi:helix-turn-helix domain-containing protein [Streptomyces phaeochromogenes]|uniref:helix-turn-helix domain-containing protein n=1 Tax=Streptomyces phaeochromogenes TaxID=1923 RepID=UPI002DDC5F8F|nr:helix-turn-helix domain-containing protein [Streptomyces phaeochromogenes]WRZ26260.1 helix-turn-helix domain-containing protein [Streptomyces phaeochromogenes]
MFDGERLRQARSDAAGGQGLSAAALAELVGATKAQIISYEKGTSRPDPARIRELAEALSVAPLDLSDPEGRDDWSLADLRRASGLRASDMSAQLGLSPRVYRRLEAEGLVPPKHFGLMGAMARCLGAPVATVEGHLARALLVVERVHRAQVVLNNLMRLERQPGRLSLPNRDDPEVLQLAALYRRPAPTVARIVGEEIIRVRGMQRRLASYHAMADYGTSADEQAEGHRGVRAENQKLADLTSTLAHRLDIFFRSMLPEDLWRILAQLYALRATKMWLASDQLRVGTAELESVPPYLLEARLALGELSRPEYRLSDEGVRHCHTYRPWYDVLYPNAQMYLQMRETSLAGHSHVPEIQELLAETETVLFSFDGLLCRLFTQDLQTVSDQLLQAAQSMGLTPGPHTPTDPVGMLRALLRHGSRLQIGQLDRVLTRYEIDAAQNATPVPGTVPLLQALVRGGWHLAVVTDHAERAVTTFLQQIAGAVPTERLAVFGRPGDLRLMKPNPHGLALAAETFGSARSHTLLLGESVADALAAQAAGVQFIGVAPTPRRARMLRDAGTTRTVRSVHAVTEAVRGLLGGRPQ